MNRGLQPKTGSRSQPVRVGVSRQEKRLEKEQAERPNRWTASEPRQDVSAHHGLHQEQEERAQEDRGRERPSPCLGFTHGRIGSIG